MLRDFPPRCAVLREHFSDSRNSCRFHRRNLSLFSERRVCGRFVPDTPKPPQDFLDYRLKTLIIQPEARTCGQRTVCKTEQMIAAWSGGRPALVGPEKRER